MSCAPDFANSRNGNPEFRWPDAGIPPQSNILYRVRGRAWGQIAGHAESKLSLRTFIQVVDIGTWPSLERAILRSGRPSGPSTLYASAASLVRQSSIRITLTDRRALRLHFVTFLRSWPAIAGEASHESLACMYSRDSGSLFGGPVIHALFPSRMQSATGRSPAARRFVLRTLIRGSRGQPIQISRNHLTLVAAILPST